MISWPEPRRVHTDPRPRSGPLEASSPRRHHGAGHQAVPTPERTTSPVRHKNIALVGKAAIRELWPHWSRDSHSRRDSASMGVAVGVAVGVRYRSITHFLLPAILVSISFDLPNIWYLNLSSSPLFYLWPSMPPLLLAKAAFIPIDSLQLIYALAYGVVAVGAALFWASRAIDRFVVRGELAA